ncbi:MAG: hypothetical protein AB8I08_11460 [Sandaracinaceae bacterium]
MNWTAPATLVAALAIVGSLTARVEAQAPSETEVVEAETEPSAPTEAELETARQHFARGMALQEERRLVEALAEFEHARAIVEAENVVTNLVLTLRDLGRYRQAIAELTRYVEVVEDATDWIEELRENLAFLVLEVSPADAEVLVDGAVREGEGAERALDFDPGAHRVEVRAEGRQAARFELRLESGQRIPRTVALAEVIEPSAAHEVEGPSDAVALNTVSAPEPAPTSEPETDPVPGAVAIGVGAALALGGVVIAAVGFADYARVNDAERPTPWSDVADSYERAVPLQVAGSVVAAVGLGAVLVGAVLLSLPASGDTSVSVGPGSLELRGRF